jgi:methylase of polypeptide subunit release factors
MTARDERTARQEFSARYAVPTTDVAAAIEQRVIGAVWGANGYTTLDQADELASRLDLAPGATVLDIGTGRGWPGVYYAARFGCRVVGTDMPVDALTAATRRARTERAESRFFAVAAAGANQPFRPSSFDAIVHTDVLC